MAIKEVLWLEANNWEILNANKGKNPEAGLPQERHENQILAGEPIEDKRRPWLLVHWSQEPEEEFVFAVSRNSSPECKGESEVRWDLDSLQNELFHHRHSNHRCLINKCGVVNLGHQQVSNQLGSQRTLHLFPFFNVHTSIEGRKCALENTPLLENAITKSNLLPRLKARATSQRMHEIAQMRPFQ